MSDLTNLTQLFFPRILFHANDLILLVLRGKPCPIYFLLGVDNEIHPPTLELLVTLEQGRLLQYKQFCERFDKTNIYKLASVWVHRS